jgi:hypothetical protein
MTYRSKFFFDKKIFPTKESIVKCISQLMIKYIPQFIYSNIFIYTDADGNTKGWGLFTIEHVDNISLEWFEIKIFIDENTTTEIRFQKQ